MKRMLLVMLALMFAKGAVAQSPPLPEEISLAVGETMLLVADVRRAALGSGKVVSLATPQRGQLLLFGEQPGQTTAELWLSSGTQHHLRIHVRERDLTQRLEEVKLLLEGAPSVIARISGRYVILDGTRASAEDRARAAEVAALFPNEVLDFVADEDWEAMVQMQVRLIEVRRDQLHRLGLRWDSETAGPRVRAEAGAGTGELSIRGELLTQLASRIDLLQQQGLAYTLAEPVLSCRSGGVARFVSGGEIPIPVTDGLGATDVQFKEYGIILELRPRTGRDGAIYANVEVELSQVDTAVRVGDYPGFVKRHTSTAVNMQDGESVAIAGLLMRERGRDRASVPGLGSIPVAGGLFRSTRRLQRETELVVLITPRRFEGGVSGGVSVVDQQAQIDRSAVLSEAEQDHE